MAFEVEMTILSEFEVAVAAVAGIVTVDGVVEAAVVVAVVAVVVVDVAAAAASSEDGKKLPMAVESASTEQTAFAQLEIVATGG